MLKYIQIEFVRSEKILIDGFRETRNRFDVLQWGIRPRQLMIRMRVHYMSICAEKHSTEFFYLCGHVYVCAHLNEKINRILCWIRKINKHYPSDHVVYTYRVHTRPVLRVNQTILYGTSAQSVEWGRECVDKYCRYWSFFTAFLLDGIIRAWHACSKPSVHITPYYDIIKSVARQYRCGRGSRSIREYDALVYCCWIVYTDVIGRLQNLLRGLNLKCYQILYRLGWLLRVRAASC